ncbi:MAG: hypothetical protein ACK58L_21660 [Planctomycetota bacterium]
MSSNTEQSEHRLSGTRRVQILVSLPVVLHLVCARPVEPVSGGDSGRHLATSIFFQVDLTDMITSGTKFVVHENPRIFEWFNSDAAPRWSSGQVPMDVPE